MEGNHHLFEKGFSTDFEVVGVEILAVNVIQKWNLITLNADKRHVCSDNRVFTRDEHHD